MPVRFFFSTNDWKLLSLPVSPINIGNRPFSLRFFTRMKSLFIIGVVTIQYECQLHIPFSFHPASLQWGLMNFSFLCWWKVFLAGICYAIPLSYWSWFSDCPIGLHLLLFSFPHLSGLPYQIRLFFCLCLYITRSFLFCQHIFIKNFNLFIFIIF